MPTLTIPNTFSASTTAQSSQVNANFSAIATFFNSTKLDDTNLQDDGISGVKLKSSVADGTSIQYTTGVLSVKDSGVTTSKILDANVTLAKLAAAVADALVPAGSVLAFGGTAAPSGYLMCDGTAVSRSTYSGLFTVVGVAHGQGNGTTTFNLPDYRGRFLRGVDNGAGRDPDAASRTIMNTGGNTGDAVGTLQADAVIAHTHGVQSLLGGGAQSNVANALNNTASTIYQTVNQTPAGGSETRPKNANVNYIIKT